MKYIHNSTTSFGGNEVHTIKYSFQVEVMKDMKYSTVPCGGYEEDAAKYSQRQHFKGVFFLTLWQPMAAHEEHN